MTDGPDLRADMGATAGLPSSVVRRVDLGLTDKVEGRLVSIGSSGDERANNNVGGLLLTVSNRREDSGATMNHSTPSHQSSVRATALHRRPDSRLNGIVQEGHP